MMHQPYRLSQQLARRRMLYPSTIISAPSVLVIDMPPAHRGAGLALDRYYTIILENDEELAELDRFLNCPRAAPVAPDIFDHRPSAMVSDNVLISRYEPPEAGWPWLLVCRWPESYATAAGEISGCDMARGSYTTELFHSEHDVDVYSATLLKQLSARGQISLRLIVPEAVAPEGRA